MPTKEHMSKELVEITVTDDMTTDKITKEIQTHSTVCNVDLSAIQNGTFLGKVVTNQCGAYGAVADSDCFLILVHSCRNGKIEWKLQTTHRSALFELIQALRDLEYEVELISLVGVQETYILTHRQDDIIQFALNKGYFDCPKKVNLQKIAQHFGISISTASEILRRGIKKIVTDFYNVHQKPLCPRGEHIGHDLVGALPIKR